MKKSVLLHSIFDEIDVQGDVPSDAQFTSHNLGFSKKIAKLLSESCRQLIGRLLVSCRQPDDKQSAGF